jgi:hypothetical protein
MSAPSRGQQIGETPRTAAEVYDERRCGSIDVRREQALPQPSGLGRKGARLVVRGRDLGLVVIHAGNPNLTGHNGYSVVLRG